MAATMLTELTPAQWADIHNYRDQLITELCDPNGLNEAAVTTAAKACYAAIGNPKPAVVWVDGPMDVLLAGVLLSSTPALRGQLGGQLGDQLWGQLWGQLRGQLRDQLGDQLWDQLRDQLWDQLWDQLGDQLGDQLRGQLRGQLWGQLGDQLGGQLGDQLWGQLRGQLGGQLGDQLRGQLGDQLWGVIGHGWWSADMAFWLTINRLHGISPVADDLRLKAEAIQTALRCHWWLPLGGVAIMSRQHTELHRDNRGRLHNPTGPAWAWADGTKLYALEGIRLPDWAITAPDPARFLAELTNAEQRRVAFAAYGWQRSAEQLGWKVLDDSGDPYTGCLYQLPKGLLEGEEGESLNLLVGRNGSPHPGGEWAMYGLPVAKRHRTAAAAQASLWGIEPEEWLAVGVRT